MKNQKGITLVALVVTIVVLLILAGITIMYVMSDTGIFGKAKDASSETHWDNVKSTVGMALSAVQLETYAPNGDVATAKDAEGNATAAAKTTAGNTVFARELNGTGITVDDFAVTYHDAVEAAEGTEAKAAYWTGTGNVKFKDVPYAILFDSSTGSLTVNGK